VHLGNTTPETESHRSYSRSGFVKATSSVFVDRGWTTKKGDPSGSPSRLGYAPKLRLYGAHLAARAKTRAVSGSDPKPCPRVVADAALAASIFGVVWVQVVSIKVSDLLLHRAEYFTVHLFARVNGEFFLCHCR
jgi:hypothetical protein